MYVTQAIFLHPPANQPGGMGKEGKENKMKNENQAKVEEVKICEICGKMIVGECDFIQTRRRTKIYVHKGMKCRRKKC